MCVQLNLGVKKTPPNLQKPDPPNRCLSDLRIELEIEVVVVGGVAHNFQPITTRITKQLQICLNGRPPQQFKMID